MRGGERDRATVRLVGVPVDEKELRDRRGTYEEKNLLERGEMDDKI